MTDNSTHANPNKNRTPRHRAREFALQGLYQWLLNNEPVSTVRSPKSRRSSTRCC